MSDFNDAYIELEAIPAQVEIPLAELAVLVVDPQRDFMEEGGYGEQLGNNPKMLRRIIEPAQRVLKVARAAGIKVVFTREGHLPDLSDCPPTKLDRWPEATRIGQPGPMGRILIRGEPGHDIIPELAPLPGELIIDKPGKDSFYQTPLEMILRNWGIRWVIEMGVTTDVCVGTTARTGNDRGFNMVLPFDGCASYSEERHKAELAALTAQGGIFARQTTTESIVKAFERLNNPDL